MKKRFQEQENCIGLCKQSLPVYAKLCITYNGMLIVMCMQACTSSKKISLKKEGKTELSFLQEEIGNPHIFLFGLDNHISANLIGPVCMRPGRSQSGRSRFGDTCSIIYNKFLHDTGMENAQTSLKSSRPLDRADYLQSGANREREKGEHKYISGRSQLRILCFGTVDARQSPGCKKQQWQARRKIKGFVIIVPVSCEHADNFDFHPGLTSPQSHVNGAL